MKEERNPVMDAWTGYMQSLMKAALPSSLTLAPFGAAASSWDARLREVLEGPRYATLWNMDREMLELQQRAATRDKHVMAFQAVEQKAWNTAFNRFAKALSTTRDDGAFTWRELADRWLAIANESLVEAHRTNAFVEAQSNMLRAASEYRLQERKLAEAWCEAYHVPTRTEMDEMQRTVTELRRQVRLQQRQLARQPEPSTTSHSATKRRATPARARRTAKA